MKTLHKLMIAGALMLAIAGTTKAQNADAVNLLKQGVDLHDQAKYPEAIEKYQQALKIDPNFAQAEFELSFSLMSSGKGSEAIPHLEKVIKNPNAKEMLAGAYDMLGSIYDDNKEFDKAIESYKKGITANPNYQRLHYNLGVSCLRQGKYAEAEANAVNALKLDPRHASSHKLYAAAALGQSKNVCSLLAYCNFLMLEPATQRSQESYGILQKILHGNISQTDDKHINLNVSQNQLNDSSMGALNLAVSMSVISTMEGDKKNLPPVDQLQEQLKSIFMIAGELSEKNKSKDFFWTFYADYFYKLAKSSNMPTATRLISLSGFQQDNGAWLKAHGDDLKSFSMWLASTKHDF